MSFIEGKAYESICSIIRDDIVFKNGANFGSEEHFKDNDFNVRNC